MSILDTIVADVQRRLAERRAARPLSEVERAVADAEPPRSLVAALEGAGFGVIGEHKRRSPSAGAMLVESCARAFAVYAETPWVAAVSVLTEEDHFGGCLEDLAAARERTRKPILRKDFIVDAYQVWEARAAGADAILLMTGLYQGQPERLAELYRLARQLGLDVLFEIGAGHGDPRELAALVPAGARLWGVNSRRFKGHGPLGLEEQGQVRRDLAVSLASHRDLRALVPAGCVAVAESGLHTVEELLETRRLGYHAALIGTAFVAGPRAIEDVVAELGRAFSVGTS